VLRLPTHTRVMTGMPTFARAAVTVVIALSICTAVAAVQFGGTLRTADLVSDAEPQTPEPRLYRVYETPEQLTLLLRLANESSKIVFVDQTGLERDVRFTVNRDGRNVRIRARWHPDTRQEGRDAPVAVSPGNSTRMDPGRASNGASTFSRQTARGFRPDVMRSRLHWATRAATSRSRPDNPGSAPRRGAPRCR
jgi:hypothetical protein